MSYKVIHYFTDLQDFNHSYNVGDAFPRIGINVSQARLNELAGNNNKQGKPLIKKIEDDFSNGMNAVDVETEETTYTKSEINRMPIAELRKLADSNGVEDVKNKSGSELKKILIKHFGL